MARITYYHILGVSSDATADEIVSAFRRKVKEWHPDISRHPDAEERMREINEAAEVLCDPERRARYDRALAGKVPFDADTAPWQERSRDTGSRWSRLYRAVKRVGSRIQFSSKTARFTATGCAGLCILCLIAFVAFLILPDVAGTYSPHDSGAEAIPIFPAAVSRDTMQAQEDAGDECYASGDYEGALRAYNAVIAQDPVGAGRDLWYNRGLALNALGLHEEAAESFDRALEITPGDSFALAQKGAALLGLGRYEESLVYTDKALTRNPDVAWIWNNRAFALEGLGQEKEARIAFENAGVSLSRNSNALYRDIVIRPVFSPSF
ncbi:MAG: chaperone protein DnaJ [Methanoregula sp. PtaU1.Bin051]|nr:MAG: chaperone protein DnaJ [Methanoregula sp. PtaU1.Bin051]